MSTWVIIAVVGVLAVAALCASVRILEQYERGAVEKNSTIVFPAPLMSTVHELGAFLRHESQGTQRPADAPPAGSVASGADAPLAGIAASWETVR
jgi:hypothetical protein